MADVMLWWQVVVLVVYYITLPFVWLVEHLLALLALVLAPLLHVLSYALHLALVPIRLLAKLETLYIFFGTAIILGLLTGLVVFVATSLINPALGIKGSSANLHIDHLLDLKRELWPPQRLLRRVLRRLRAIVNEHVNIWPEYEDEEHVEDEDEDDYASDLHRHDSDHSTAGPAGAATLGRTAASFNAERAEKRARLARQQAILGLATSATGAGAIASPKSKTARADSGTGAGGTSSGGGGKGRVKGMRLASGSGIGSRKKTLGGDVGASSGTTSAAGVADGGGGGGGEWTTTATSRDFGPPTPMMGTMILEEEDDSSSE